MNEKVREVYFKVEGVPVPKGSVSAFPIKRKNGHIGTVVVHLKRSKVWEAIVRKQAPQQAELFEGPIEVESVFFLPRPRTVTREYPCAKGRDDIDKLERAILDSLKGVLYHDDGQVVTSTSRKRYEQVGVGFVGAMIWVRTVGFPAV